MNAILFVNYYLKYKAVVTIKDTLGNIVYEGRVHELPRNLLENKQVAKISGLGECGNLIIELEEL